MDGCIEHVEAVIWVGRADLKELEENEQQQEEEEEEENQTARRDGRWIPPHGSVGKERRGAKLLSLRVALVLG